MNSRRVRLIFIGLFIFLPIQYALVGVIGDLKSEPWPAFVFPGFKNVYVYDNGYEIDHLNFEIYTEGKIQPTVLLTHELFPELPKSQISGFLSSHFQDAASIEGFSDDTREWLKRQAIQYVGATPSKIDVVSITAYFPEEMTSMQADSTAENFRVTFHYEEL